MKRLISILVIATMLFASVLAMIPASAATSDEPLATYNVNWKSLVENGKMKTRWAYDPDKHNYEDLYNVDATENSITSTIKDTSKEYNIQYYSEDMFKITENTYYEYVFSAKNADANKKGYAGVAVAYALNNEAYCEEGDKGNQTDIEATYFLWGAFQNKSDEGDKFCIDLFYGYRADGYNVNPGSVSIAEGKQDADGYITYKVVYDGYNVTFFYTDANGEFAELFGGETLVLPENSAVCVGMYNRGGTRYVHIKDAKITAWNRSAAAMVNGSSEAALPLAIALDAADKIVATDYTDDTAKAFTDAVAAGTALFANKDAEATALADAATAINDAIAGLVAKKADVSVLGEKIASLETIENIYDKYNFKTIEAWVAKAEAAMEREDILISEVDALVAEFDAMIADEAKAITTAEEFAAMEAGGNYILANDITITASYGEFKGMFNGNGKTITLDGANGVFKTLNGAIVKNFAIAGSVTSEDSVAALATGAVGSVYITDVINNATVTVNKGGKNVAAFVAETQDATLYFSGCVNNAAITGGRTAGFVANVNRGANYLYFYNCLNKGNISCAEGVNMNPAAGFVARTADGSTKEIEFTYCANFGDIKGTYSTAAFFACGKGDVTIYGCVNVGDVFADYNSPADHVRPIGGFVGGNNANDGAWDIKVEKSVQLGDVIVEDNYEGNPVALLVGGSSKGAVTVKDVLLGGNVIALDNNVYKITSNADAVVENAVINVTLQKRTFSVDKTQDPIGGTGTDDDPYIYPVATVDTPNPDAVDKLEDTNTEIISDASNEKMEAVSQKLMLSAMGTDADLKKAAVDEYFAALAAVLAEIELIEAKTYAKEYIETIKKAPEAYTAESYAAYLADINAFIALIDAATSYEDLTAVDGDKVIADAEAKLVTLEAVKAAALAAAKQTALTALSAKRENAGNTYTAESYAAYIAAYDAIVAQINGAATIEALDAIDVAALKVAAEAKLAVATPEPSDDETDAKDDEKETTDDKDDETEAKDDETKAKDDETEPKKEGGCGSSVALSALAIVGVIGTAVVLKKKED